MLKETEAEATLENCRALINQITVGLSAEKPFIDFLSVTEVLLYLDFACSALKKSAPLPRERRDTMRPTTAPSAITSKSSSFHWPDGRLADARFKSK